MNTAAPSHFRKKLLSLVLTLVFMLTCLPAALAVDLNVDAGFYFKQSRGGTCTLASAAMMLRRRAYFDGQTDWVDVTENSVRSTAWSNGLAHSFTYREMQVAYATLPSNKQEKTQLLIQLLAQHPEGIVLYDRTQPHAVLLTDYTNGVFYCSDPAGNISSGRIPLTSSSVSIARASCYWYVTADHNSVAAQADGLRLEGVRYPVGKLYEDIPVAYEVTKRAHKVAHIANRDYYYFQRGSSIQNMAFNPRKLDSVRHCHALMENVKRDFPRLSRAAECRYLSNVCNILFQIQDRQHEKIEKALWQEVKKYRRNVLLDPQARKKARLAAALSYRGYAMTRRVYEKTQWRGKK